MEAKRCQVDKFVELRYVQMLRDDLCSKIGGASLCFTCCEMLRGQTEDEPSS